MTDKDNKIQRLSNKNIGEDSLLWAYATKDVKPIKRTKGHIVEEKELKKTKKKQKSEHQNTVIADIISPPPKAAIKAQKPEIDRKTAEKLRKGQYKIDARLDLHSLSKQKAYQTLCNFVLSGYERGFRCVLIITGKGAKGPLEPETGVLKQHTPVWLSTPPLGQYILKVQLAKPKDGGSGALYVLLRRKKEFKQTSNNRT